MNAIILTDAQGNPEVLYEPTPKQELFHARLEPRTLFYGGRGSGKSKALRWEAHARAMSYPGFKYAILRRTYPELEKSHLLFIEEEMQKLGGRYLTGKHHVIYPNGSRGIFSQCQDPKDVLNLLSAEFYWMGFDELSTFPWEMFVKLAASVRVPRGSGLKALVRCATNPLGASADDINRHFLLKDITQEEEKGYNPKHWYAIKANLEDNPHVDWEEYAPQLTGLPSHVHRAWVDGDFGIENALFDFFPTKKVVIDGEMKEIPYHVIGPGDYDLDQILKHATIYRALDSGWFPDPTYCLWIAHLGNRYIVLKEKFWYKKIAPIVAADIKEIDAELGIKRVAMTYCDPTMSINTPHDIRTLMGIYEDNGIPMEVSINNREMYASFIHTALGEEAQPNVPRLQISRLGCPYLIKSLPQQRFDPKKPLRLADHPDDHPAVTLAYFLISGSSLEQRQMAERTLRPWMIPKPSDRFVLGRENVRDR